MFSFFTNTNNTFEIECFGALGGTDTNNLTSFYLKWGKSSLLIDGGSLPLEKKSKWSTVDLILLTHSHLDHTADIFLNKEELKMPIVTDLDTPFFKFNKSILVHDKPTEYKTGCSCVDNFETYFGDEQILHMNEFIIKSFPLHHHKYCSFPKLDIDETVMKRRGSMFCYSNLDNICRSHCYIIQHKTLDGVFVFFGDFTTAFGNEEDRARENNRIIDNIKKKVNKKIDFMVVECAMPNKTQDEYLFGHMKPNYLKELWETMHEHNLIDSNSVAIVNHMKPNLKYINKKLYYDYSPLRNIRDEILQNKNCLKVVFCDQFDRYLMAYQTICGFGTSFKTFDETCKKYNDDPLNVTITEGDKIYISCTDTTISTLRSVSNLLILSPAVFSLNFQHKKKFAFSLNEEETKLWNILCNNCIWPELFGAKSLIN